MLSRRYRTIFVHVPKAAGQSVEQVFLDAHGLTWARRRPLLLRRNTDPDAGPLRLAHLFAREYVELGYVTQAEFDSFHKFAIVRNPIDRIVSAYNFVRPQDMDLAGFLDGWTNEPGRVPRTLAPQAAFVQGRDGRPIIDCILRFERLAEELPPVLKRIFGDERSLPHRNRSAPILRTAQLSRRERRLIIDRYEPDFDLFGYDKSLE